MWLHWEIGTLWRWFRFNEVIRMGSWSNRTGVLTRGGRDATGVVHREKAMWGHSKKVAVYKPGREASSEQCCWHLDHALLASRTVRNKCLLFKPPNLWHLLWQPKPINILLCTCSSQRGSGLALAGRGAWHGTGSSEVLALLGSLTWLWTLGWVSSNHCCAATSSYPPESWLLTFLGIFQAGY